MAFAVKTWMVSNFTKQKNSRMYKYGMTNIFLTKKHVPEVSVTIYLPAQISPLDISRRSNHCKLLYLSVLLMMFLSRTRSRLRLRRWLDSDWLRYYASYNSGSGHRHPSVIPASDWSDVTQARLWLVRCVPSLSVTPGATLAGDFTGDTGSDTQHLRQVKKV